MQRPILAIAEDFSKYEMLVYDLKKIFQQTIRFSQDKPTRKKDMLWYENLLEHSSIKDQVFFMAEQKKVDQNFYKFQLRCPSYCEKPIFRFDSDGSAHQNKSEKLKLQSVPTPHFNKFNNKGESIAYQTPELENIDYSELQRIGDFFVLFCEQCHLRYIDGTFPFIESGDTRIFQLPVQADDLLEGIKFPT
ncbi:hypothetical protein SAMN05444008_102420 [Cnuella takakiae]|uniref:Uncharacterized protein n=1 Tax=Cnuella takakiae TaxID=1302690 RepID=A0A1M4VYL1_9BACT|nr:hypothetical protein [Cnuella takakiae]OLY92467.1 hypothetical protein BUE76_11650 [Cnuella takakiae]SHE73802.1 hypothetical protein SAMN05444008_102420 [Cnuella takakiae]